MCLLTAVSLLTFLGRRYPVKLLPCCCSAASKLLWLALVALPKATTGDLDAATETMVSCSLVVVTNKRRCTRTSDLSCGRLYGSSSALPSTLDGSGSRCRARTDGKIQ